jgi:hypothetical protein
VKIPGYPVTVTGTIPLSVRLDAVTGFRAGKAAETENAARAAQTPSQETLAYARGDRTRQGFDVPLILKASRKGCEKIIPGDSFYMQGLREGLR